MEKVDYVQNFIDYLYEVKSSEMLAGISKESLEAFYGEYLNYINESNDISDNSETLYMIDRNSIFNAICYVVNNYSSSMTALQDKHSEWVNAYECSTLIVYHKLVIKSYLQNVSFETEVDRCDYVPDSKDLAIVNYGKQTYIDYYELKDLIYPVISSNSYCCELMELIDDKFNDVKVLTDTDVCEILNLVKKKNPRKVKRI